MLPEFWDLIERVTDFVHTHWREPNNGIWENIERKLYVSSLVLCWAALDRASRLARMHGGWEEKERKWSEQAEEVRVYVMERGFDREIGSLTYAIDDKRLDAAVLTAITYGMFSSHDEISRSTIRRIRERLSRGDMLLRHLLAEEAEHHGKGLPAKGWMPVEKRDNPFHPCTLWLAQAYALTGDTCTAESILHWAWSHAGRSVFSRKSTRRMSVRPGETTRSYFRTWNYSKPSTISMRSRKSDFLHLCGPRRLQPPAPAGF